MLPLLFVVLFACLSGVRAAAELLACQDAARAGARAAARGDSPALVAATAARQAPPGATVALTRLGALVRVDVRAIARPLPGLALPGFSVSGHAVADTEQPR